MEASGKRQRTRKQYNPGREPRGQRLQYTPFVTLFAFRGAIQCGTSVRYVNLANTCQRLSTFQLQSHLREFKCISIAKSIVPLLSRNVSDCSKISTTFSISRYTSPKCGFLFLKKHVKFGRMVKSASFNACSIACYIYFPIFRAIYEYYASKSSPFAANRSSSHFFTSSYESKRCSESS